MENATVQPATFPLVLRKRLRESWKSLPVSSVQSFTWVTQ